MLKVNMSIRPQLHHIRVMRSDSEHGEVNSERSEVVAYVDNITVVAWGTGWYTVEFYDEEDERVCWVGPYSLNGNDTINLAWDGTVVLSSD